MRFRATGTSRRRAVVGLRLWLAIFAFGMLLAMLVLYPAMYGGEQGADGTRDGSTQDKLAGQDRERFRADQQQTAGADGHDGDRYEPEDAAGQSTVKQEDGGESRAASAARAEALSGGTMVRIQLTGESRVETVPIEWYVRGVVAGEMPADFHMEALKAQAIAARTYIVRKLLAEAAADGGKRKADVSDRVEDQVYVPVSKLAGLWPDKNVARQKLDRISEAVAETKGLILTYGGEPIQASYFSTSNGYTENSEDYWSVALPYLRSVPSPWDTQNSPRYKHTVTMKLKDFYKKLDVPYRKSSEIKVISRTDGRRVKELAVGKERLTGREVREKLGLHSAHFVWEIDGDTIALTSFGYGHGVGMSQYGANALAEAGNDAKRILRYYYTDVTIEQASKLPEWAASFES